MYKLHDNFPSKIVSGQKPFTRSLSYILSLADCSFNTFFNAVANWLDFSFSAVTASNAFSASYKPHPNLIKHTSKVIFETDPTSLQLPITFSMPRSRSTMNISYFWEFPGHPLTNIMYEMPKGLCINHTIPSRFEFRLTNSQMLHNI